jgi:probable addiction module antidote protein
VTTARVSSISPSYKSRAEIVPHASSQQQIDSSEELQGKEQGEMKRKTTVSHDEAMVRRLRKDQEFAAEYLKAALEESDDPSVLLVALRRLAHAHGIAKVAKATGIERESLYRALSEKGNPRLSTLVAVTKVLTVEAAP